jgi:beta-glucosidase
LIKEAAASSDSALVFIGRSAGEERENTLNAGGYYLTEKEETLLNSVCENFEKVAVVMNTANIIDMSWLEKYGDKIGAVLLSWQGGMESGNSLADVLWGKTSPSGKLTDTIAKQYTDYPSADSFGKTAFNNYEEDIFVGYRYFETFAKDRTLFPFGFGLSYTTFKINTLKCGFDGDTVTLRTEVTNSGDTFRGKEVVQVYCAPPQGALGKPARNLTAFAKTKTLAPSEKETLTLSFSIDGLASFDDSGKTGEKNAYILEGGTYEIYVGCDVREAVKVFDFTIDKKVVKRVTSAAAPVNTFKRTTAVEKNGTLTPESEDTPLSAVDLKGRILENLPEGKPITGDKGYKLKDVKDGRVSLVDFTAQLSLDELEAISRGDYKSKSPLGVKGSVGVLGGVLKSLRDKGVTPLATVDGPSGIRLKACCALIPCGTAVACSWNLPLVEEIYQNMGKEMLAKGADIFLAPALNIHRNPLCGRNFECFSECPFVSGKVAAAVVKGVQAAGGAACPKHFACNNQEANRYENDSRVSERALREIYLKGFEICVKEAKPFHIMTSYNKINGVWGHYHYDLCSTVLRKEWGYEGNVMTDWWMQHAASPEFPSLKDNAYRVRAGVDVLMPGDWRYKPKGKPDGTLLETYGQADGITLGEMQKAAVNVLSLILKLKCQ